MNYLVTEVVEKCAEKWNMRRAGNKWVGHECPGCGKGSSGNDKFHIWDDGGWKCWSCEKTGDIVSWLRGGLDADFSMSCAEAHEYVNVDCLSSTCKYVAKCRVTRGKRRAPARIDRTYQPRAKDGLNIVQSIFYPHPLWVERMGRIVEKAHNKIFEYEEIVKYLEERGVTKDVIINNKFGYLPHDERIPAEELGIVFDPEGKKKVEAGTVTYNKPKVWIPGGVIMPLYSSGNLFSVDVRRSDQMREKFLPKLKYMLIKGSGVSYRALWDGANGLKPRAVVVIEARLCASIVQAACPDVAIIVGKDKPLAQSYADSFRAAQVILIATDNDTPGREKAEKWGAEFDNAHYWPVPVGKDPGEYYQNGGDIKEWIEIGISKFSANRFIPSPRPCQGREKEEGKNVEVENKSLEIIIHGKTIHIVKDDGELQKNAEEGKIVFTVKQFVDLVPSLISLPERAFLRVLHYQSMSIIDD